MSTQVKKLETPYGARITDAQQFTEKATFEKGIRLQGVIELIDDQMVIGSTGTRLKTLYAKDVDLGGTLTLAGALVFADDTFQIGSPTKRLGKLTAKNVDISTNLNLDGSLTFTGSTVDIGTTTERAANIFGNVVDVKTKLVLEGGIEPVDVNVVLGLTRQLADVRAKKLSIGSDGIIGTTGLKFTTNAGVKLTHTSGSSTYDVFTTGNKPSWSEVGGNDYMTKTGTVLSLVELSSINPKTDKATALGTTGLRLKEVWSEIYRGKDVDIEGDYKIAGVRMPVFRNGTTVPDNAVGKDGDFYIQRTP